MPAEPVMFSFADLYTDLNFGELAAHHQRTGAALTVAVHWDQVTAPFGGVTVDGSRVSQYVEKPSFRYLAGSGAAVMSPAVSRRSLGCPFDSGSPTSSSRHSPRVCQWKPGSMTASGSTSTRARCWRPRRRTPGRRGRRGETTCGREERHFEPYGLP